MFYKRILLIIMITALIITQCACSSNKTSSSSEAASSQDSKTEESSSVPDEKDEEVSVEEESEEIVEEEPIESSIEESSIEESVVESEETSSEEPASESEETIVTGDTPFEESPIYGKIVEILDDAFTDIEHVIVYSEKEKTLYVAFEAPAGTRSKLEEGNSTVLETWNSLSGRMATLGSSIVDVFKSIGRDDNVSIFFLDEITDDHNYTVDDCLLLVENGEIIYDYAKGFSSSGASSITTSSATAEQIEADLSGYWMLQNYVFSFNDGILLIVGEDGTLAGTYKINTSIYTIEVEMISSDDQKVKIQIPYYYEDGKLVITNSNGVPLTKKQ